MPADRRKTGEGAMKGWATRRRHVAERQSAREALIDVMDEIGGMVVHGARVTDHPGKFLVGAVTLIGWRDRISATLRALDGGPDAR